MNTRRLLQRFLRYVKIDTTARMDAKTYPSSPGQLKLGRLLVRELKAMGIEDAQQDKFGIVLATVPATAAEPARDHRLLLAHGYLAGDDRQRREAAGDPQVPRRRYRAAGQPAAGHPRQRESGTGEGHRSHADHHRRHDLAGRRRQGRPGHYHGSGRMAHGAPGDRPRADPPLLHLRRRSRPRRRAHRYRPDRRRGLLHASTATAATRSTWRPFPPRPPRSPFAA